MRWLMCRKTNKVALFELPGSFCSRRPFCGKAPQNSSLHSPSEVSRVSFLKWCLIHTQVFFFLLHLLLIARSPLKGCSGRNRDVSITCTRTQRCSCATIRSKRPSAFTKTPAATKTATTKRRRWRRSSIKRLSPKPLKTSCCCIM